MRLDEMPELQVLGAEQPEQVLVLVELGPVEQELGPDPAVHP